MPLGRFVPACVCVLLWVGPLAGQDFRVSTKLYDERAPQKDSSRPEPLAHSWTIFHAGKAYDSVDSVDEVTVLEPAHERIVIVNTRALAATELSFEEIETLLHQAQQRAQDRVRTAPESKTKDAVVFQIKPEFQVAYDQPRKQLKLSHPLWNYDVQCAEGDPERVAVYLRYADWTSRLNYMLHPQMLPNVRLALNSQLADRKLLPTSIRLRSQLGSGVKLRAEHQFQWSLTAEDRRKVSEWESLLSDPDVRKLPFKEFQQAVAAQ